MPALRLLRGRGTEIPWTSQGAEHSGLERPPRGQWGRPGTSRVSSTLFPSGKGDHRATEAPPGSA